MYPIEGDEHESFPIKYNMNDKVDRIFKNMEKEDGDKRRGWKTASGNVSYFFYHT